ncbi:MAG TPA: dihydrodipicolinate synthase family protein [Planctomycetota bacterium]
MAPSRGLALSGLIAAPFTPTRADGGLDLDRVPELARSLAGQGVAGAFVGGTTGEGLSFTGEERIALHAAWARAGRPLGLRVLAHVGATALGEAQAMAARAQADGCDGIGCLPPFYFKPATVAALVDWFAALASAAPRTPFYLYDLPAWTGVHLDMVAFLEQAAPRIPNLAGLKHTNPDQAQYLRCLRCMDGVFEVGWGSDEALLAGLALGARFAVGSTYNFAAPLYQRLIAAFQAGELEQARVEQERSAQMVAALARHGFLPAARALMDMIGVAVGPPRLPLLPVGDAARTALRAELTALGFFEWGAPQESGVA